MNAAVNIRNANQTDIAIIQNLAMQAFPATYHKIVSKKQIEYMLNWMYNTTKLTNQFYEGVCFCIAEQAGEPIAYASYGHEKDNTYKLHKLYILPHLQQTGIGKQMLAYVINKVLQLGGQQLQLQVNKHNKAVGFYTKMGFEIAEAINFPVGEGYFMDDYIMQLDL